MGNQMLGGCCYDREAANELDAAPERRNRKQYKIARKPNKDGDELSGSGDEIEHDQDARD